MKELLYKLEEEKRRLDELGQKSLEQGIPLGQNEVVQAQSRKVDELIVRFLQERADTGKSLVRVCLRGGEIMEFPSWFQSAIQQRLDYISTRIERHPDLRKYRAEEGAAFEAMFSGGDNTQWPEFIEWEDKHHLKRALENERLYLQGMRDGVQLIVALLVDPFATVEDGTAKDEAAAPTKPETEGEQ
ncbi:hypothetical protein ACFFNY_20475 [Paenibacillus hodogayensis]|uniref:Aspartyl-phosphate phosphatase Spo0E family protein n=1 Tax=Paenibacillus hodogayensis TaxID=279208 RepID=A0ABV5W0V3_9BACL